MALNELNRELFEIYSVFLPAIQISLQSIPRFLNKHQIWQVKIKNGGWQILTISPETWTKSREKCGENDSALRACEISESLDLMPSVKKELECNSYSNPKHIKSRMLISTVVATECGTFVLSDTLKLQYSVFYLGTWAKYLNVSRTRYLGLSQFVIC